MADSASPSKKSAAEKKILVIDDDESVVQMIRATLEAEGFQVKTGRDGRDIVKKALDFRADLILSDLMMPGSGGYDVLRLLQSDDMTRKIPVILITGFNADQSTKGMIQQESNLKLYMEKPIRPEKLVKEVHKILNTVSLRDAQKQPPMPPGGGGSGGDFKVDRWAL